MSTTIRPEVSEKNKYWIERHRYYELKHFCMQFPLWKKAYLALFGLCKQPVDIGAYVKTSGHSDPTAKCAEAKIFYSERIDLVSRVAKDADQELADYILKGVTEGRSYDNMKARLDIPCCKETYYEAYRRFFWLLDKERQ